MSMKNVLCTKTYIGIGMIKLTNLCTEGSYCTSDYDTPEQNVVGPTKRIVGPVTFRDDIDVFEQLRFKKRYQRKCCPTDVVTLQDVKDLALYTAPPRFLDRDVINILHLASTERLIRASIMYSQYYLQITDVLKKRTSELLEKIPSPSSKIIEDVYRENLEDFRLLVAKEYCGFITGAGEFAKYHHMGRSKTKTCPLLKKDRVLFETIVRIIIQIIWIALGRKSFDEIEIEMHRLFKSHIFNFAQHSAEQKTKKNLNVVPREVGVLRGKCMMNKQKLNTLSPLMDEVHCKKNIDYKMFGIGVIEYPRESLSSRLRLLEGALTLPETSFEKNGINMGILGAPRSCFDTMLNEIPMLSPAQSSFGLQKSRSSKIGQSRRSLAQMSRKSSVLSQALYKNIRLPPKDEALYQLDEFVSETKKPIKPCLIQRKKWLNKVLQISKAHFIMK
ncbi:protein phosphatase 1 regulatory subunit 36-like isoform X2 [Anticarsia gemmatalis]|uniref:protein phosphatase 1 regulatory subunit 36-like isoform X2 n=1 Tax=Anticarsia gemmatalis TaxID=129554 RepID=UPI003F76FE2A